MARWAARTAIEIKSTTRIEPRSLSSLRALRDALPGAEFYCIGQDPRPQRIEDIQALPWEIGLETF